MEEAEKVGEIQEGRFQTLKPLKPLKSVTQPHNNITATIGKTQ